MNTVLPNYVWIIIIVVVALILLYILYIIASNRRFHKMVDPQLEALRQYDERRRRAAQNAQQAAPQYGDAQYAEPVQQAVQQPVQAVNEQVQQAADDYTWQDQTRRR